MADATLKINIEFIKSSIDKEINKIKQSFSGISNTANGVSKPLEGISQSILDSSAAMKALNKESGFLNTIESSIGTNNAQFKNQSQIVQQLADNLKLTDKQIKNVIKSTRKMNFDFFTFIFAGAILERTFGGALTSIIDNYKRITGLNSVFNKTVLKLGASWSFLKFAIGNALNSPFIIKALEFIIDGIEFMGDLISDNQFLAVGLLAAFLALAAFGGFAVLIGSLQQLVSLLALFGITLEAGLIIPFLATVGIITGLAFLIYLAFKNNFGRIVDSAKNIINTLIDLFFGLGDSILLVFGSLFDLIIGFFEKDQQKFEQSMKTLLVTTAKIIAQFVFGISKLILQIVQSSFTFLIEFVRNSALLVIRTSESLAKRLNGLIGFNIFKTDQSTAESVVNTIADGLTTINDAAGNFSIEQLDFAFDKVNQFNSDFRTFEGSLNGVRESFASLKTPAENFVNSLNADTGITKGLADFSKQIKQDGILATGLNLFNTNIGESSILLPTHTSLLKTETEQYKLYADQLERSANAQDRLNTSQKKSLNSSPTTRTEVKRTTRTSTGVTGSW